MNRLIQHILSTAVAGVLILIPIGITVFVFFEISDLLMGIVSPIAALLPVKKVAGIDVTYLVSAALIFAGCYLLGQGIRTRFGQRINEWVEGGTAVSTARLQPGQEPHPRCRGSLLRHALPCRTRPYPRHGGRRPRTGGGAARRWPSDPLRPAGADPHPRHDLHRLGRPGRDTRLDRHGDAQRDDAVGDRNRGDAHTAPSRLIGASETTEKPTAEVRPGFW